MDKPLDPELERAAGAVADREGFDWARGAAEHPDLGTTLEGLRDAERVAAAHREARRLSEAERPPQGPEPQPAPAFTWGHLQALVKLAEGSFGEVWRAWEPSLRRPVALKLRRPGAGESAGTRRWLEEARRLARVRHPHVVAVYGAAEHDGRAGLWTELVEGETLEDRLRRDGPLGPREAAGVGMELCGALAAVHAAGLVHGDVTTTNVVRESAGSRAGRLVLLDFGSAQEPGGAEVTSVTPLAAAPETLEGHPATAAADLYALGVLLFRLVTGRYPVEASTLEGLRARHARGERTALRTLRPDLPAPFVAAVERALAPDLARRFRDAAAMERALEPTLGRAGRPALLAAAALAAVAVVGLAATLLLRRPPVEPSLSSAPPGSVTAPPSAAEPPPAAASAAPVPLDVEFTLLKRHEGITERLDDGGRLAVGDRLALEVSSGEPVWVYALNEDRTGGTWALFPLAGLDAANPLAANAPHRLPGRRAGRPFGWVVTSEGGEEAFLLVASRKPLPEVERALARLARVQGEAGGELLAARDTLRGVAALAEDPIGEEEPARGTLAALARRLEAQHDAGVKVRLVRASHAPP